jgi:hypothetical protein
LFLYNSRSFSGLKTPCGILLPDYGSQMPCDIWSPLFVYHTIQLSRCTPGLEDPESWILDAIAKKND